MHNGLLSDSLVFHHRLASSIHHGLVVRIHLRDLNRLWLNELGGVVGFEVLHNALGHEKERKDETERQQQVVGGAHQIDPKIAQRRG